MAMLLAEWCLAREDKGRSAGKGDQCEAITQVITTHGLLEEQTP